MWLLGHHRGEENPRGRQGASKEQGGRFVQNARGPFWLEIFNFHLHFGAQFWVLFWSFFGPIFETLLGRLRARSGAHFGAQKWSKRSPKRSPRAAKTRSQSKTLPNQKRAFRLGGSSLFGSWGGPRRGPAEAKDALCRPSTFKKEGQKKDPKKDTKKDDDGAKKEPRRGPKNRKTKVQN